MCYGVVVIRTQILLDAATYDLLRKTAAARHMSVSGLARELFRACLGGGSAPGGKHPYDFSFVGKGRGKKGARDVAVRHDAYLGREGSW
jgi:hypothetical protein